VARRSQSPSIMTYRWILVVFVIMTGAVTVALILRPPRMPQFELAAPADLPPAVHAALEKRMERHGAQMGELVSRLIVLDFDGAARVAGALYDEPTIARPLAPDDLNRLLPDRFFALQEELTTQTRWLVTAAAQRDPARLAEEFGRLTKTCVICHSIYLHERRAPR
jgi:hypothetical protein